LISRVGIVVPTLGERHDYLEQCLLSIRKAGDAHIVLVAPASLDTQEMRASGLVDSVIADDGSGLPSAVNKGIHSLPKAVEYVNWLGDDDLLTAGSIGNCTKVLDSNQDVVMVFGTCEYINGQGATVWTNASGQWAVPLMRFGPDLIPQPGALFRRSTFEGVGSLKTDLGWAFDFDLFIRFGKIGKLKYLNQTLAKFRWHPESLSVEHRRNSVAEASQVRLSHLPSALRPVSFFWEYPVRIATLAAGARLTAKTRAGARHY
jgi:hypothetical protein